MIPAWQPIYSQIKSTVFNLGTVEDLLCRTATMIAARYQANCQVWAGLDTSMSEVVQVCATAGSRATSDPVTTVRHADSSQFPEWLQQQQQSPRRVELETGELILPIVNQQAVWSDILDTTPENIDSDSALAQLVQLPVARPLQLVLLLCRTSESSAESSSELSSEANGGGWSAAEVESLEVVGSQLGLAYSALYWKDRLDQSRQQSALIGRIVRLVNSNLNPDEVIRRIVAELGQGLGCDRCLLVDLRDDPVNVLASWDQSDRDLKPLMSKQIRRSLWLNVIEMFTQAGASYIELDLEELEPDPLQIWLQDVGATGALLFPLLIQEEFFGAIALLSYDSGRSYQVDELQTIRQISDQTAIALTNAQHYQSLWYRQEALRLQNDALQGAVIQDELTQLMNRRSLDRELEQLSASAVWAVHMPFCAIVCDLDYFKWINDTHGHAVGDEVLRVLAQRLQRQLRRETPAYRYGGEEFVVILAETTLKTAVDVAERLRQAVRSTPFQTSVGMVQISASFGVSQQTSGQDRHARDVLQRAEQALSEAKRQGRDRVESLE